MVLCSKEPKYCMLPAGGDGTGGPAHVAIEFNKKVLGSWKFMLYKLMMEMSRVYWQMQH